MSNSLKRIFGYFIGYLCINSAIPNPGLKEYIMTTVGGLILIATTLVFMED